MYLLFSAQSASEIHVRFVTSFRTFTDGEFQQAIQTQEQYPLASSSWTRSARVNKHEFSISIRPFIRSHTLEHHIRLHKYSRFASVFYQE